MSYYTEHKSELRELAACTAITEVHGVPVIVKEIPAAHRLPHTALDGAVYERRKAAAEKGNPLALYEEIPVDLVRAMPLPYTGLGAHTVSVTAEERVIETRHGDTPITVFTPAGGESPKPAVAYYHGGAYIAGSTAQVAHFCELLAEKGDCVVVSVDYRLAPEHQFPAGAEDAYDGFCWLYDHAVELGCDKERLFVAGDSAGGTLAIDACLFERDAVRRGDIPILRIKRALLIYPGVIVTAVKTDDYRFKLGDFGLSDSDEFAQGAALSLKAMVGGMGVLYTGTESVTDPVAAPLLQESLADLPPATIAISEFDYLRPSIEAYCRKLLRDQGDGQVGGGNGDANSLSQDAGNRFILYRGMDHSFIDYTGDSLQAFDLARELAADLYR